MTRLSQSFLVLLMASMSLLVAGLGLQNDTLLRGGLSLLIAIPIFRAIYATLWFYSQKKIRAMWLSISALAALAISILLGV